MKNLFAIILMVGGVISIGTSLMLVLLNLWPFFLVAIAVGDMYAWGRFVVGLVVVALFFIGGLKLFKAGRWRFYIQPRAKKLY